MIGPWTNHPGAFLCLKSMIFQKMFGGILNISYICRKDSINITICT